MDKTHRDFLNIIGNTHKTAEGFLDKKWNEYYQKSYVNVVARMVKDENRNSIFDVGTSYGHWMPDFRKMGFKNIYGVELSKERALVAEKCGYEKVYNCDAAAVPHPDNSIDIAVSNDVFVHILQLDDKINVMNEVYRMLKPGGCFILNHTMSKPYNFDEYFIRKYTSYLSLDKFTKIITENTDFLIEDFKPTYYALKPDGNKIMNSICWRLAYLPGFVSGMKTRDLFYSKNKTIEYADTVYVKLRKKA